MTRQSRMLLILTIMGIACVSLLGLMAHRYSVILGRMSETDRAPARTTAPTAASRLPEGVVGVQRAVSDPAPAEAVARFIVVRRSLRARLVDDETEAQQRQERLLGERERAFAETRVAPLEYARVRGLYRGWREDPLSVDPPYAEIFRRRQAELASLDLGPYESYDR